MGYIVIYEKFKDHLKKKENEFSKYLQENPDEYKKKSEAFFKVLRSTSDSIENFYEWIREGDCSNILSIEMVYETQKRLYELEKIIYEMN